MISNSQYLDAYFQILKIRRIEEKIAILYEDLEMRCPIHLSIGQEAIPVGVTMGLSEQDIVMSGHRSHAHYLAKKGNIDYLFGELYGKENGCTKGIGGSMHLVDLEQGFYGAVPIVGSTIPIAVGMAFANQLKNNDAICVIYLGEGATEEGVFYESLQFACLRNLNVLFVCENNLYSVYSHIDVRQSNRRRVHEIAGGLNIFNKQIDGNNITDLYNATHEAVQTIKNGQGPCFLECLTYRWLEHCGPNYDNHIGYRTEEEFKEWKKRCPLHQLEKELKKKNILSDSLISQYEETITKEIESALQATKTSTFANLNILNDYLYAK